MTEKSSLGSGAETPCERRLFLKQAAAVAGASLLLVKALPAAVPGAQKPPALRPAEMSTLKAIMARMLPADASGGGALEAGAPVYVDRALSGVYVRHLPAYRQGLAAVTALLGPEGGDTRCCDPRRLDEIIAGLEAGAITAPLNDGQNGEFTLPDGGRTFFKLLRQHMLEGVFGDPIYGGNRDFLGWQMINYTGVQLYYTEAEQAINGPRTKRNRSVADFGAAAT